MGLIGVAVIIIISYLFSSNKSKISLRTVISAFLLLLFLSLFVSITNIGTLFITFLANIINIVLEQGKEGAKFLFGDLAGSTNFIFAIVVLSNIIFLGALFSLLYYLRIMQPINNALSYILHKLLKITKPEALSATINLFIGPGETLLVLKPYLSYLTKAEMFTVMVSSFSAIAGSIMGGYIALGMPANYIISAIFLIVPSSIFIAKIMQPEEVSVKDLSNVNLERNLKEEKASNIIEAIAIGTTSGLKVAVTIGAMLITFVSLLALANVITEYIAKLLHFPNITLPILIGYIFAPVAYIMGVPTKDIITAGLLIAEKTFTNEFVAFIDLKNNMEFLDTKTQVIIIFALCGFANFGTVGIFIGSLQVLLKERVIECSKMAFKALFAAILVNLLNATIAGLIFDLTHLFK